MDRAKIYDSLTLLKAAGEVSATGQGSGVKVDGYTEVDAVINITTLAGTGTYTLIVEGSTDAGFSSPVSLATMDIDATGKYVIPFRNEIAGTEYPYVRIAYTLGGTTPSIDFAAWLAD